MAVDQSLAQASNVMIYSAMLVYTGALGAFALDLSGRGRAAERTHVPQPHLVTTNAASETTPPPSTRDHAIPADHAIPVQPPNRGKALGIAISLTWLAFALHLGAVAARGAAASRPPWGNMYEFTISGAVVVTGVFLAVLLRRRDLAYLGTFVVGPVLLSLGLAITKFYTQAAQLVPALQSYWLVIHVSVAFIAAALLTIGFSATVLQLVQERREQASAAGRPARGGRFMNALPASVDLERTAYRLHAVAFPLWTFTVIAGAIWAEKAWGRYWNWDPKEVWSFVIWVVYAGYLHARATRGWDGRRAAYLAMAGYACVLFNFVIVNIVFPGLHSYADVG